jgi:hypothetical protein
MAEKDVVIKEVLKFAGYTDFKNFYSYAHDWLKGEKYSVTEDQYTEKVKGNSKEIEVVWKASKKLTDYFKAELDVKFRILGLEDVEVEIDGKKNKMNKAAEIKVEIKGTLIHDYGNQWNKTATTSFFKSLYNKYIIPEHTEKINNKVEDDVQNYKEELKAFLELTGKK